MDLHLSISNGFVSSKIYDKRDDFDFDVVNFPFLDGDVPHHTICTISLSLIYLTWAEKSGTNDQLRCDVLFRMPDSKTNLWSVYFST